MQTYDQETTQKIVEKYNGGAGATIAALAAEFGRPERSIIAKLSSLGVYQKKPYLTKQGELPIKKAELVERIAQILQVNLDILGSLEKANKNVLQILESALKDAQGDNRP